VAIGQGEKDVQEFGVYADDLTAICIILGRMTSRMWQWKAPEVTGKIFMWNFAGMALRLRFAMANSPKISKAKKQM
jgi:hypothetical protein